MLIFDITPVKLALGSTAGSRFAQSLVEALPECATGQPSVAAGGHLTRCIDAEGSAAAAEQITAALPALIDTMPDHVVINDSADLGISWFRYNWLLMGGVRSVLDVAIIGISMMALLAGLVGAYLGGSDLRTRLKWASFSLFAPGSLIFLSSLILTATPVVNAIGSSATAARYSEAYREALINLLAKVIQQVDTGFLITGGVVCLVAFGLLVWSLVTPAGGSASAKVVQVPVRNS